MQPCHGLKKCNRPGCVGIDNGTGLCDDCQAEYIGDTECYDSEENRRAGNSKLARYFRRPGFALNSPTSTRYVGAYTKGVLMLMRKIFPHGVHG